MSSVNEELQPQPKPRASPLDFRNTDLVSRLLAATPPYLYNMPIVPNSYFFSEMLRSFVQAKTDTSRLPGAIHQRRPRKRSWTQARAEYYHRDSPKSPPKHDLNLNDWTPKQPTSPERLTCESRRLERPLELTMGKMTGLNGSNSNNTKVNETEAKLLPMTSSNNHYALEKHDMPNPNHNHAPLIFPTVPQNLSQESTHPNLMLPPPPPIWYPPLYPPPYGFDPLHFFIDLRVSGHIYDRKNEKDNTNNNGVPSHTTTQPETIPDNHNKFQPELGDAFKQSRHMSAFSVPVPATAKNIPINLSSNKAHSGEIEGRERKFDVKSMGFETSCNKTGTNYVMNNIARIYKDLGACKIERDEQQTYHESPSHLQDVERENGEEKRDETDEEKEKRVKDLRALIGLELVVDYMNQAKPNRLNHRDSEESSTDIESADSPSVEVVACSEEL